MMVYLLLKMLIYFCKCGEPNISDLIVSLCKRRLLPPPPSQSTTTRQIGLMFNIFSAIGMEGLTK